MVFGSNGQRDDMGVVLSNAQKVIFGDDGYRWVTDANGVHKVNNVSPYNSLIASVSLDGNPNEMAFDTNGKLWVVQPDADTVTRIDPTTATIEATITVGDVPRAIAADDDGFVWVTIGGEDRVIRLSATPMSTPDPPTAVAGSAGDDEVAVSWSSPADTGGTQSPATPSPPTRAGPSAPPRVPRRAP